MNIFISLPLDRLDQVFQRKFSRLEHLESSGRHEASVDDYELGTPNEQSPSREGPDGLCWSWTAFAFSAALPFHLYTVGW